MPTRFAPRLIDGYVWIGVCLLGLLTAGGLFFGVWLTRQSSALPSGPLNITIGQTRLAVPQEWLRGSMPRLEGPVYRLELALPLARYEGMPQGVYEHALERGLLLSITAQDQSLEPSARTRSMYARFLTSTAWSSPGDLVLRQFTPGSPYEDEELYLSPPDGQEFWARCKREAEAQSVEEGCLTEVRMQGLDIQARFARSLLPQWKELAPAIRESIGSMIK